jgi:hypothetical protein
MVETDWEHQGRYRSYPLSKVTLADGRTLQVAGKAFADPFTYLLDEDWPVTGAFRQVESTFSPGTFYWLFE